jgi:hypothetical protein
LRVEGGLRREGAAELVHRGDPAEEGLDVVDRGLLDGRAAQFVRRVFQHHREIFEMEGIAQRRFDAHVGGDAGEHQMADAACAQVLSSVLLKKPL